MYTIYYFERNLYVFLKQNNFTKRERTFLKSVFSQIKHCFKKQHILQCSSC